MNRIAGILFKYRWELLLFIGIPLASDLILVVALALLKVSLVLLFPFIAFPLVKLVLMLLFYLRVRLLGRNTLSEVWGYSVVAVAVSLAVNGPLLIWISEGVFESLIAVNSAALTVPRLVFVPMVFLAAKIWFARRLSRTSLSHGFLLVALPSAGGASIIAGYVVEAAGLVPLIDHAQPVATILPSTISRIVLACLAVVVLSHFDSANSRIRVASIVALLCVAALAVVAGAVSTIGRLGAQADFSQHAIFIISNLVLLATQLCIAFALVYLVRARNPKESEPPTNSAAAVQ